MKHFGFDVNVDFWCLLYYGHVNNKAVGVFCCLDNCIYVYVYMYVDVSLFVTVSNILYEYDTVPMLTGSRKSTFI